MLIPIAIAINIILGQTVAAALKVPIYLDSIGTILVGVLAGPIAGALTGGLANLIWTYVLPAPFHSDYAAPFFIVAVEIGLLAGIFGRLGFFRSRPEHADGAGSRSARSSSSPIVAVIGIYGFLPFYTNGAFTFFACHLGAPARPFFVILGWLVALAPDRGARRAARAAVPPARPRRGVRLRRRAGLRDRLGDHLGADLGVVFGGVTGSRHGPPRRRRSSRPARDLQPAVLKQGLLSDPIDKTLTFFIVFAILGRPQPAVRRPVPAGRAGRRPEEA